MSGQGKRSSNRGINAKITRLWYLVLPSLICVCLAVVFTSQYRTTDIALEDRTISAPMRIHVRAPRDFTDKKLVALTFDDGPGANTTPRLLDILKEKDVKATFFQLGNLASRNGEIVKRVVAEGHEIGSHTMTHQELNRLSTSGVSSEIDSAKMVFQQIIGYAPTLLRPPYGSFNQIVQNQAGAALILWSVDTRDWQYKNTDSIMSYVKAQVFDGAIILMHDIYPTSVDAVPTVVDYLRSEGYEFVTVSELAALRGVELSNGSYYYSFKP